MKKLMTLLFSFVLVFSLAMPVFAQDTTSTDTPAPKASKKEKKAKKEKKSKKSKKNTTDKMAAPDATK
jgi:hypothetical protein